MKSPAENSTGVPHSMGLLAKISNMTGHSAINLNSAIVHRIKQEKDHKIFYRVNHWLWNDSLLAYRAITLGK